MLIRPPAHGPARFPIRKAFTPGFTLVELLVVIGIIALLIGILLPTLSAVRRQAASLKCAAALREIGNCFQLYQQENKGFAPVAKCPTDKTHSLYRITFSSTPNYDFTGVQYWPNFLAKYAGRAKTGMGAQNAQEAAAAMKGIFWGCPAFEPYINTTNPDTSIAGQNVVQLGYGMNAFPEYTATYPPINYNVSQTIGDSIPDGKVATPDSTDDWKTFKNRWYKFKQWTNPAERALVADCRLWILEAQSAPKDGSIPPQYSLNDQITWDDGTTGHQTLYDFYRHGKYPALLTPTKFSDKGGKVGFNILYADGHVRLVSTAAEGYKAARMRYPG
jgi:prepilin-type N-terminal cleavage/methylation domain-containing protein/prepilin-type processing-associated H-X9-DG protein